MIKIAICGVHGTGKSRICEEVSRLVNDMPQNKMELITEQFREVVKDIPNFEKQTEEITLATYGKQLYLENLYTAQGKNILCDRSVLDTFVYYEYFNNVDLRSLACFDIHEKPYSYNDLSLCLVNAMMVRLKSYTKIYLIEPSDREIESDGFRLTDKKQQLEIHELFLKYFNFDNVKNFDNVEIVDQEDSERVVEECVKLFSL